MTLTLRQKQQALQKVSPVYFEPDTFDDERDIPQIHDLDVTGVAFNNDGTIECGTSCAGYLFPFNDNDLSDDEKKMLIEAAYDYRFGSES